MSRRPRPTDNAVESSEIDCAQSLLVEHTAGTFPAVQSPAVQRPGALVTESPDAA